MRPAVHNMTADQIATFRKSYAQMMAISDNRGYGYWAGQHGAPQKYCWHHQKNDFRDKGVVMEIFLPWHRAYLYYFEMAMRAQVGDAVLPWWDWTLGPPRQSGIPQAFADVQAGDAANPLHSFKIPLPSINHTTTRQPGDPDDLIQETNLDDVLSRTGWNDFCGALEDIHDFVHGWVSGDMGVIATSAYDPIFWSHHCMIDRVWSIWQGQNGNGNIPTNLLDVVLVPFHFKVRDVLNTNDLGYDYAAAQVVVTEGVS